MAFTVTLQPASTATVTVNYQTADGSAAAGSQYTPTSGTLTFAPGVTTQTVNVPVLDNSLVFADNYFFLNLSAVTGGANLLRSQAFGIIESANVKPQLSVNAATVTKPATGTVNATFGVTLSSPSTNTVTVNYATADGTATSANNNYVPTSGTSPSPLA